jgi:hypothetical protein
MNCTAEKKGRCVVDSVHSRQMNNLTQQQQPMSQLKMKITEDSLAKLA